jgi:hypothetical protein
VGKDRGVAAGRWEAERTSDKEAEGVARSVSVRESAAKEMLMVLQRPFLVRLPVFGSILKNTPASNPS